MSTWAETTLFKMLEQRNNRGDIVLAIRNCMRKIEAISQLGGTSPPDFTLHDAAHGFRVTQMMSRLLQRDGIEALSDIELSLLLLSAFCHDIGMTPSRDLVRRHQNYLITGDKDLLSRSEASELQSWLDENWDGLVPPIVVSAAKDSLLLSEEINAYYCRHKHNDWSEDWIRGELSDLAPSLYAGWVDDLVALCRSHHEGLSKLRGTRFDARIAGSPSQPLNLRYLAAVLRVADVLEFDPERTPEIILRHRSVAPKSKIYWYKDHAIAFELMPETNRIIFTARTPTAAIHKAVLMTADWVDAELATCSALEHEGAFKRGAISEDNRRAYTWNWPAKLTHDIAEIEGSFVYIDGAFRPSASRILNLLSGTALYGEPIVAIRELLQNALDAVREQTAYERLQLDDPLADGIEETYSRIRSVRLTFLSSEGRYWLRCTDNGAGMTRAIIEKHLLVSGSGQRAEVRALERDAKGKGFSVGRTGQFGIGVLSYFMVADQLEVVTRRSQEAGDTDGTGWRFTTEGVGAFGELSRESRGSRGTDVLLRLRPEVVGDDPVAWFRLLRKYVESTVNWVPCQIHLRDEVSGSMDCRLGPGWTLDRASAGRSIAAQMLTRAHNFEGIRSAKEEESLAVFRESWERLSADAEKALRWAEPLELPLADGAGIARVWLPYFDLPGGKSIAFFDVRDGQHKLLPSGEECFIPRYAFDTAWRGFAVEEGGRGNYAACIEVDFRDGKEIKVDRRSFSRRDGASRVIREVAAAIEVVWKRFLEEERHSLYALLNHQLSPFHNRRDGADFVSTPVWNLGRLGEGEFIWQPVKYPLCDAHRISFYTDTSKYKFLPGVEVMTFAEVVSQRTRDSYRLSESFGGGSVALVENDFVGGFPAVIWRSQAEMKLIDGSVGSMMAAFPPNWHDVIAINTPSRTIINQSHSIVSILDKSERFRRHNPGAHDLGDFITNACVSPSAAFSFIVGNAWQGVSFWRAVNEKFKSKIANICDVLRLEAGGKIILWRPTGAFHENIATEITHEGIRISWKAARGGSPEELMPVVGSGVWTLRLREVAG